MAFTFLLSKQKRAVTSMWLRKVLPCILLAIALVLPTSAIAGKGEALRLQERMNELLPSGSRWALTVISQATGKEIMSIVSAKDEPLIPGSLIKLITAGAVLDSAESLDGLKMKTSIFHSGALARETLDGNIYLTGRGNALLTASDLKAVAEKISGAGIKRITGDIIADDTFFDTREMERSGKGTGDAPAGALGLDLHTMAVIVTPAEPGNPPKGIVEPPNDTVKLAVEARTSAESRSTIRVAQIDDTSYRVTGTIPADSAPLKQRFALQDPALYAAGALGTSLNQIKVKVEGKTKKGKTPGDAKLLAEIEGPDLQKMVRDMNVNSLNVVADNLLLLLGAEKYGKPGTREKGVKTASDFLGSLGLSAKEATISDGSGLSRKNRVTAKFMANYLQKIAGKKWFQGFRDSLPRAGIDGTLKDIGYRNEKFRVKSGRLENVFALAGYGVDANNKDMAFAFIVNAPGAGVLRVEQSGAEVMRYLATEGIQ